MTVVELAKLVEEMRKAQRMFLAGLSSTSRAESKRLESQVDRACREVLEGRPAGLTFGDSSPGPRADAGEA